jgi:hypothetical protein
MTHAGCSTRRRWRPNARRSSMSVRGWSASCSWPRCARFPFRQIVGVEISPALHEIARDNRERFSAPEVR